MPAVAQYLKKSDEAEIKNELAQLDHDDAVNITHTHAQTANESNFDRSAVANLGKRFTICSVITLSEIGKRR